MAPKPLMIGEMTMYAITECQLGYIGECLLMQAYTVTLGKSVPYSISGIL